MEDDQKISPASRSLQVRASYYIGSRCLGVSREELWTNGLICAFEYVKVHGKSLKPKPHSTPSDHIDMSCSRSEQLATWVPIGWARISELVQTVHVDARRASQQFDFSEDKDGSTVEPTWWCHVDAGHPAINVTGSADRVCEGLLFELLGKSASDPLLNENDIPVVLRSWQAQNFLVTALHVKGTVERINVLGIAKLEELLLASGDNTPRTVEEVIAHLATRLACYDDRLFHKSIYGAADEVELMFVNRSNHEDIGIFNKIMYQEIRSLSRQVIRVKHSLLDREKLLFELLYHLNGNAAKNLLESLRKSTRLMIDEQEVVRGRLLTIENMMQNTIRECMLQDRSLRMAQNLVVFSMCGLVLCIITALFRINEDGIPGYNSQYAYATIHALLFVLALILIMDLLYLKSRKPFSAEQVAVRTHRAAAFYRETLLELRSSWK